MLIRRFHEDVVRKRHRIDYAGAAMLAVGGSLVILGLLEGGSSGRGTPRPASRSLASAAVLLSHSC